MIAAYFQYGEHLRDDEVDAVEHIGQTVSINNDLEPHVEVALAFPTSFGETAYTGSAVCLCTVTGLAG